MSTKSPTLPPAPTELVDWDITDIVAALRRLRDASLAARQRLGSPVKLPSKKALAEIVNGLSTSLFPNRLGSRVLADESIDYFVGHTLDLALRELGEQIERELMFQATTETAIAPSGEFRPAARRSQAVALVREFAARLPHIRAILETDIVAAYEGDPAARSVDEVLACYPGITAIVHHRIAHVLHDLGALLTARIIAEIAHASTGIDIHPGARIGESFFIDHGTGVVIGETAIIGRGVRLYHGVTLGAKRFNTDENGVLVKGNARHPIVEDDVVIYAGATVLGRITIGRGSVIGGNVWLTHSVPPGSNISQAKLRGEEFDGGSGI
jgi:serine O-acetyltransferase